MHPPRQDGPQGWQHPQPNPAAWAPPSWQPGAQPPKKGGGLKVALLAAGGVLVLAAAIGGVVVFTGDDDPVAAQPAVTAAPREEPTGRPPATEKPESSSKPTSKPEPSSGGGQRTENEEIFLTTVRQRPALKQTDSATLLRLGRSMCKAFDDGKSLTDVATGNADRYGLETSAFVTGAAIVALCPRHRNLVPGG
ncbi:DUF732 domain-containing protein [Streptosporangium sandarakinum]